MTRVYNKYNPEPDISTNVATGTLNLELPSLAQAAVFVQMYILNT